MDVKSLNAFDDGIAMRCFLFQKVALKRGKLDRAMIVGCGAV